MKLLSDRQLRLHYLPSNSGLIYHGPDMIQEIVNGLKQKIEQLGFTDIASAMQQMRNQ